MNQNVKLTFKIRRKFPEDFLIDRLAKYLSQISTLVGSGARLASIKRGSVSIVLDVPHHAYPEVVTRVASARRSDAPAALRASIAKLQSMCEEDRVDAEMRPTKGARILYLNGFKTGPQHTVRSARQAFTVRGRLIGLEGKDDTKHARISEFATGSEVRGEVRAADVVLQLRELLFEPVVVEFFGSAILQRDEDGVWRAEELKIDRVERLTTASPSRVFSSTREALSKSGLSVQILQQSVKAKE